MKKFMLMAMLGIAVCKIYAQDEVPAQTSAGQSDGVFYIGLAGGAALPVGNFGKNLFSGYQINKTWGVAGSAFYSKFRVDEDAINDYLVGTGLNVSADHWQYYGVQFGPTATVSLAKNTQMDFRALGGIAHVNMPIVEIKGSNGNGGGVLGTSKEKWTDTFTWQIGSNIRYNFDPKFFLYTNLDYNFMKPTWSINNEDVNQKMGVVNLSVGLGASF
jgi:hypothetical protein